MTLHSFSFDGRPKPKDRPRATKNGHMFTPQATLDAQKRIEELYDGPVFDGPISATLLFRPKSTEVILRDWHAQSPLTSDLDNLVKLVLDGLQGVAFENDRQVHNIYAEKVPV